MIGDSDAEGMRERGTKRERGVSGGNGMRGMRGREGYTDKMDGGKRSKIGDRLRDEE